ncbi:hypothetical protein BGW80DRAFT_1353464 [Lactifluus volemus]|nr:hypothetical protein BGW80DRAFT_1353464 [Lactifluus volemus]
MKILAFPLCSQHVHTLCTLLPFISWYMIAITPVVAILDDLSVQEELRAAPGEVAHIFDHLLEVLLDSELAADRHSYRWVASIGLTRRNSITSRTPSG